MLGKAKSYLDSPEIQSWIEDKSSLPLINFADEVSVVYRCVMEKLPSQASKLMWHLLGYYGKPISPAELSIQSRTPGPAVRSQLSRLVNVGFVTRTERGKYSVQDPNFLIAYAIQWDTKWPIYRRGCSNKNPSSSFREFLLGKGVYLSPSITRAIT